MAILSMVFATMVAAGMYTAWLMSTLYAGFIQPLFSGPAINAWHIMAFGLFFMLPKTVGSAFSKSDLLLKFEHLDDGEGKEFAVSVIIYVVGVHTVYGLAYLLFSL